MSINKRFFIFSLVILFYVFGFGISKVSADTFAGNIQYVPDGSGLTAIGYGSDDKACTLSILYAPVNPDGTINFNSIGSTSVNCTNGPGNDPANPGSPYQTGRYAVGWTWSAKDTSGGKYSGSPYVDDSPALVCFYQEYASLVDIGNNNTGNYKTWGQPYTGNCKDNSYADLSWLKRVLYAPAGTVIVSIGMSLANDGDVKSVGMATRQGPVAPTPITVSLSASPTSMTLPTNSSTLTWTTTGDPETCTATGSWSGAKSLSGGSEVRSGLTAGTYTYGITCSKAGVTDYYAEVVVNVAAQVCNVVNFYASPNPIVTGSSTGSTTITSDVNCDTDIRRGSPSGTLESQPPSGNNNTAVTNVSNGTVFYLQKRGDTSAGGTLSTLTVNLSAPAVISVSLSASPTSMTLPTNSSTLTWSVSGNPDSCIASGDWSGSKSISGSSEIRSGLTAGTYTYGITCSKSGIASVSSSATITVNSVSPITVSLSASPSTMSLPTNSTQLMWSTTGSPTSCVASGASGWSGSKSTSGNQWINGLSTGTYTYTITCSKSGTANAVASVTVTVNPSVCNYDITGHQGYNSSTGQYSSEVHTNDYLILYGTFGTQSEVDAATITYQPSGFPVTTTYRGPGQINIYPLSGTGGWTIEVRKNANCAASRSFTVISAPTMNINFTATPSSITTGNSTRLTWSTAGGDTPDSCTAINTGYGWSGTKSTSGGYTDVSPPISTSFGISCTKAGASPSSVSKYANVTVTPYVASCNPATVGVNQMVGCSYTGTSFNTINVPSSSGPVISSPIPNNASPLPNVDLSLGGPGTLTDNYSIRWKGSFNFTAGTYVFSTASDDGSRAYFDDNNDGIPDSGYLVNDWSDHPVRTTSGSPVVVSSGTRTLVYEMYENVGGAGYGLSWQKQGSVPTVTIGGSPTSGSSPLTTTLTWAVSGVPDTCTASGGWSGSKNIAGGSQVISGIISNTTYTLTCTNSYGGNTASITITPNATHSLEVFKTYGGYVKSVDTFIDCGATCSKDYASGTSVTLTPYPDSSAWRFIGWQGDCSGTGNCVLTINSPKTVTAVFSLKPLIYREF